jgi:TolA-binding protein
MSRAWWVGMLALVTGCVTAPPPPPPPREAPAAPAAAPAPSVLLLSAADLLFAQGDYARAREAYSDFVRRYPDDAAASRAYETRDVLDVLGATREEVSRLEAQVRDMREQAEATARDLERLRRDLGARQAELARVRQELGERQAELARLNAEAEQLRADLEKLKSVDLRLERR